MDKPRKLTRLLSCLFTVGCFIGFCFQVTNISTIYFAYPVVTRVYLSLPVEFDTPILGLCFGYTDVIDIERFERETGRTVGRRPAFPSGIRRFQRYFTISDIFKYTPEIDPDIAFWVFIMYVSSFLSR